MASKDAEIMLVKTSCLASCPEAFRDHVAEYFKPINLFGTDCMFAFLDSDGHVQNNHTHKVKGIAPSHNVHLRAKVVEGVQLFDWIHRMLEDKSQTNIVRIRQSWNDGTIETRVWD